jgi:hypothetical protein
MAIACATFSSNPVQSRFWIERKRAVGRAALAGIAWAADPSDLWFVIIGSSIYRDSGYLSFKALTSLSLLLDQMRLQEPQALI